MTAPAGGAEASIASRVGYVDTDAAGVAHHSSYLRWLEEARSAWVRERGCSLADWSSAGLVFAVAGAQLSYLRPLRLDDEIVATAALAKRGRSSSTFSQLILRGGETACAASIRLVCLDCATGKPVRIPEQLR